MIHKLKNHVLLYILTPLLILTVAAAFYRAFVSHDYLLTYEGECDPYEASCFVSCKDDSCSESLHYTWMTRSAAVIAQVCDSETITECDAAYTCLPEEASCQIEFCDPNDELVQCDTLEPRDRPDIYSDPLDLNQIGT